MKFKKMLMVYNDVVRAGSSCANVKKLKFECNFRTIFSGQAKERFYKIYWVISDVIMKNYSLKND